MLVKLAFLCLVGFTVVTNLTSKFLNLLTFCNKRPTFLLRHLFFSNVFPDWIRDNFKNGEYDPGQYLDILILNCYFMLNKLYINFANNVLFLTF